MTQLAPSTPKKPPHKKRHTKPCRYFQVGRCPHKQQEDCDFAHVFSDPRASLPPAKQCRYYLQGKCTNGIWCQYLHGQTSAGSDDHSLLKDYQSGRVDFNTLQMNVPPTAYVPSHFNVPVHAAPTLWHNPVELDPPSHLLPGNLMVSPGTSPDSIDFATSSSSPTSSMSEEDAPEQHYSYFSPESQLAIGIPSVGATYEDSIQPYSPLSLSVVPVGYGLAPLYDIQLFSPTTSASAGFYSPAGLASKPQPSRPLIDRERAKLATYRTKPCRYVVAGTVCPNGDACTFIHAISDKIDPPLSVPEPGKLQHELPSKPLSTKEENSRKGFFPISWRVIGGGVTLGGVKAETSDDDSDLFSDDSSELQGRSRPMSRELEVGIASSEDLHTIEFPSINSNADTDDSTTPTEQHARQRASSIPSTPITLHVDHVRLFSAESPGGL
ncbi:hypothetical protein MSAN_01785700 [Mycena sanguinolenta]|uniref:C3H1-type domain-containing protein n=1 Tax=Mycena sanguinolenta TaxID=230812 RepID=A0A8H6XXR9_9AGAR|nr:hypothetical protein MSAN_01785700 [Mycena sanguinolenta]